MTNTEVLQETLNRLYLTRSCKPEGGNKTREEEWLECLVRILMGLPANTEVPVTLEILQSPDVYIAVLDKIREVRHAED